MRPSTRATNSAVSGVADDGLQPGPRRAAATTTTAAGSARRTRRPARRSRSRRSRCRQPTDPRIVATPGPRPMVRRVPSRTQSPPAGSAPCSSPSSARSTSPPSATRPTRRSASPPAPASSAASPLPDGPAYFTSRGSVLGQVPGDRRRRHVRRVQPRRRRAGRRPTGGRRPTPPRSARPATDGAVAQLRRILGESRRASSGSTSCSPGPSSRCVPRAARCTPASPRSASPTTPLAAVWRRGDMLREFRGDSHIAAWIAAGFDATEIGLLTELYWGLPMRTYSRTRAWTDEQFDAALERLESRGLVADGAFTDAGRAAREAVEVHTDDQMRLAVDALGDDADELFALLAAVGRRRPRGRQGLPGVRARTTWRRPIELARRLVARSAGVACRDMIITDERSTASTTDEFAAATGWDPEAPGPVPGRGLRAGARRAARRRHGRRRRRRRTPRHAGRARRRPSR